MTVRVCNNRPASPFGVFGRRHDCGRIVAQGRERSINGGNSKADAGAKTTQPGTIHPQRRPFSRAFVSGVLSFMVRDAA